MKVRNVKVRESTRGRRSSLGLDRLKPGQSVLIPRKELEPRDGDAPGQAVKRIRSVVSAYQRRYRVLADDGIYTYTRIFRVGQLDRYGLRIGRIL